MSQKIDFTTFDVRRVVLTNETSTQKISSSQEIIGDYVSITNNTSVPARYLIIGELTYHRVQGETGLILQYYNTSNTYIGDIGNLSYLETQGWTSWCSASILTVPANTTYKVAICGFAYVNSSGVLEIMRRYQNLESRAPHMTVIRVG